MELVVDAEVLARSVLQGVDSRWPHTCCVAQAVAALPDVGLLPRDVVVAAAWLHDVGYSPELATTGFHPLDGARFLRQAGWPDAVVSLVAYHSGAEFEAEERQLSGDLSEFLRPEEVDLDRITFGDMTSSPQGHRVSVQSRLAEILQRYPDSDPVARAVRRSRGELEAAVNRVVVRFGLPDEGFDSAVDGVA